MRKSQKQIPLPKVDHFRSQTSLIGLSHVDECGANSLLTKMKNHSNLASAAKRRNSMVTKNESFFTQIRGQQSPKNHADHPREMTMLKDPGAMAKTHSKQLFPMKKQESKREIRSVRSL